MRRFGNDFHEWRSHEWKSLPNRLTSDKKSLFTVTNVLFYFLHAILCHELTNPLRTIIERSFRHCCQGRPFLTEHCDVTTIDLWRHANAKYWYCDVIFVYCHCTRKLAQRRSSLVNNSREYRFLATRYSRLSMYEKNSRMNLYMWLICLRTSRAVYDLVIMTMLIWPLQHWREINPLINGCYSFTKLMSRRINKLYLL